jgi:hypothetical protein
MMNMMNMVVLSLQWKHVFSLGCATHLYQQSCDDEIEEWVI